MAMILSFGNSVDHYEFPDGTQFDTNTRWSATLVKEGDQWLIASLHVSENLFDNPVLDMTKRAATLTAVVTGIGGVVVGVLCMVVIGFFRRRNS